MRQVRVISLLGFVIGLTLTLFTFAPAASARVKNGADFYTPPSPMPKKAPGTIIRSVAVPAPAGAKAWKVLYHSRAVDGRDIAVSGVVVAPTSSAPKAGRTVVTWAHGTSGLADQCAPSKAAGAAKVIPFVDDLVKAGFVVTATDYEGLGTPGVHPYLVGESEGRSVLDAARAAKNLGASGAGAKVLVAGTHRAATPRSSPVSWRRRTRPACRCSVWRQRRRQPTWSTSSRWPETSRARPATWPWPSRASTPRTRRSIPRQC